MKHLLHQLTHLRPRFRLLDVAIRLLPVFLLSLLAGCGGGGHSQPPDMPPAITGQPLSTTVVQGNAAHFQVFSSGSAPLTFQWKKDGALIQGAVQSSLDLPSVQPSDAGAYVATVSNKVGSASSQTAILTVLVPPSITTQPASKSVALRQPVQFSVLASGSSPLRFQWMKDGLEVPGATNQTLSIASTQLSDAGTYRVTVTNEASAVTSAPAELTILVAPTITGHPASLSKMAGQPAQFTVEASGSAPMAYRWKKDGTDLPGATSPRLEIPSIQASDAGWYEATVSNAAGSTSSQAAQLVVLSAPMISTHPSSLAVTQGQVARFSVTATGTTPLRFQWLKNGVSLPGEVGDKLTLSNVQPADAGSYTVTVSNQLGAMTSDAAVLTVHPLAFRITAFQAFPEEVAHGGSTTLSWTLSGIPRTLTLNNAPMTGTSTVVFPVRRQAYTLVGGDGSTTDSKVIKIPARGIDLLAGSPEGRGSLDGTGRAARFSDPFGLAIGRDGTILMTDPGSHVIRKISPTGNVSTLAGSPIKEGANDGIGAAATFHNPAGMALDDAGNAYVADMGNHTIRKIAPNGAVTTLAGLPGVSGSADGQGPGAAFSGPRGVLVTTDGTLYIADTGNHTIRKIAPGGAVTTIAGTAKSSGHTDGKGAAARFFAPSHLVMDRTGNVLVSDRGNHTIRKITPDGTVTTLAGWALQAGTADGTGSEARFYRPQGLALDGEGCLLVADAPNGTIRKVTPAGVVTTLAGRPGLSGATDGPAKEALFGYPVGIAVDSSGNILVADQTNHTLRIITSTGTVLTLAGTPEVSGNTDGQGAAARFRDPVCKAVDPVGNVYVSDATNHTIRKITPGGLVSTLAGLPGTPGTADGTGNSARFCYPEGIALDLQGNLVVADGFNSTIRLVTPTGVTTTLAGQGGLSGSLDGTGTAARFGIVWDIAVDASGALYVTDSSNHTIRKITPNREVTTHAGVPGSMGSADGVGDMARFNKPTGIAVDRLGNVYVSDSDSHTIRKITPSRVVSTLAGQPGTPGHGDGIGSAARFNGPMGLAIDPNGYLYVADGKNSAIRRISPGGMVQTLVGTPGIEGYRAGPLPGILVRPTSIAITAEGDLLVNCNQSILQITAPR